MKSIALNGSTPRRGERGASEVGTPAQWPSGRWSEGRGVEGSKTTKFEIGVSKIESIAKRLEIGKGCESCTDSLLPTHPLTTEPIRPAWGTQRSRRGMGISREIFRIRVSRELTWPSHWTASPPSFGCN
jgi:hypothetical protein